MKKICFIDFAHTHTYFIQYDDKAKHNPYKVVMRYWKDASWHTKTVERYADLLSCFEYLRQIAIDFNEDGR